MELQELWTCILEKYFSIKALYIECEETDPELKTNLQPLNEFRASLDHIMKMMWSYYVDKDDEETKQQCEKLLSHLNRCFYDISDMLSINYRNKIIACLDRYDPESISMGLPEYYSSMKPEIERISQRISTYRNEKGKKSCDNTEKIESYSNDVRKLKNFYISINDAQPVLDEIQNKMKKKETKANTNNYLIGGIIGVVGSAAVAIILHFFGF